MLRVFARLRRQLVIEGNIFKYLLYAGGEIVLIVLGIGIAFQLGNWKQVQENRVLERKLILDIRNSLDLELNDFIANRDAHEKYLIQQIKAIQFLEGNLAPEDTTQIDFALAHRSSSFLTSAAPFESLKAFGLNRISSDQIRRYIIYLYDIAYPEFEKLHTNYNALCSNALDVGLIYFDDWSFQEDQGSMQPVDIAALKKDRAYLMMIKRLRRMNELILLSMEEIKVIVAASISLIEEEYVI